MSGENTNLILKIFSKTFFILPFVFLIENTNFAIKNIFLKNLTIEDEQICKLHPNKLDCWIVCFCSIQFQRVFFNHNLSTLSFFQISGLLITNVRMLRRLQLYSLLKVARKEDKLTFSWQSRVLFHFCFAFFSFVLLLALQEKNAFYLPRFMKTLLSLSLPLPHSKVKQNQIFLRFNKNALEWRWKRKWGKNSIWSPL